MSGKDMNELKSRLDGLSDRLKERGVVDVKFDADYSQGLEKVGNDAAAVLEAMLDGRTRPAMPIGDSVRTNAEDSNI